MRRARRLLVSLATVALTVSIGLAPSVRAQGEAECGLITAPEVEAAFAVTGVTSEGGSRAFCGFGGATSLLIAIQPAADLASQRTQFPEGVDATIGGFPAWVSETARSIAVELPGQILGISYYGELAWADALPALTGLLELAIPRAPAGPSDEDIARLEALLPETINGMPTTMQAFGGDLLLGFMDQTTGPVIAFNEAMAAQGVENSDVLLVGRETDAEDDDHSVVAVLIRGADASQLLEPLFRTFASSNDQEATFTPIEVGGRPAVRIEGSSEEVLVAATSGDVILAATVPEGELESVFAVLP